MAEIAVFARKTITKFAKRDTESFIVKVIEFICLIHSQLFDNYVY